MTREWLKHVNSSKYEPAPSPITAAGSTDADAVVSFAREQSGHAVHDFREPIDVLEVQVVDFRTCS
jgi:hypothetical protein